MPGIPMQVFFCRPRQICLSGSVGSVPSAEALTISISGKQERETFGHRAFVVVTIISGFVQSDAQSNQERERERETEREEEEEGEREP